MDRQADSRLPPKTCFAGANKGASETQHVGGKGENADFKVFLLSH